MTYYNKTPKSRIHRHPERGVYDREQVWAILDAGIVAHVGLAEEGGPKVLPMIYARDGDTLYLHGARANHFLKAGSAGVPLCVTVTLVDGLVLAGSAFSHSVNYRCVVVYGRARLLTSAKEKAAVLDRVVDRMVPGRVGELRPTTTKELGATAVLALDIEEASAKVRSGPPGETEEDDGVWTGVLPLTLVPGTPVPAGPAPGAVPVPASVSGWGRPG
ncbi:MAG: pyridoxamine 5'-phosphate oxidase family protein [Acidimicrobiales bacterium]